MKDFYKVSLDDVLNALVRRNAQEIILNDGNVNADSCLAIDSVAEELMNEEQLSAYHKNVMNMVEILKRRGVVGYGTREL